jgi:oligopeptidase B
MRSIFLFAIAAGATSGLSAQTTSAANPPAAPVHEHREVRHGATVIDNYFWLREKSNPEVV